eukprot:354917-Chlamydomonas_euryale.AAC.18
MRGRFQPCMKNGQKSGDTTVRQGVGASFGGGKHGESAESAAEHAPRPRRWLEFRGSGLRQWGGEERSREQLKRSWHACSRFAPQYVYRLRHTPLGRRAQAPRRTRLQRSRRQRHPLVLALCALRPRAISARGPDAFSLSLSLSLSRARARRLLSVTTRGNDHACRESTQHPKQRPTPRPPPSLPMAFRVGRQ